MLVNPDRKENWNFDWGTCLYSVLTKTIREWRIIAKRSRLWRLCTDMKLKEISISTRALHILLKNWSGSSLPDRKASKTFRRMCILCPPFLPLRAAKKQRDRASFILLGIALHLDKCNTAGRMHRWINFRRYNAAARTQGQTRPG